jgi:vacuolar-type H+-ATPase subunit I/STV1
MFTFITGFFSNTKNIIMAIGAALIGGYVLKQKYNAYKAEDKLKTIETKIAKANVVVAKEVAKSKAEAKEIETSSTIETLRTLKEEKKKVLEEMDEIEKVIVETQKEKEEVTGRKRGKKIKVEV